MGFSLNDVGCRIRDQHKLRRETKNRMSDKITIYHNPRCTKSRQTLALIEQRGVKPDIVLYLETPPSAEEISSLLSKLGLKARELMRSKEVLYKTLGLADETLTETQLIDAMANNPKLIERPIVSKGKRAVIGRPPENVNALLG